ncbi:uncharacterized protein LOC123297599 [Chrysoperla carnea]|uniref:uncharacterized protein LOC123297599 n=1 Tax=Chrysoperla carnea TaxID=189513 RepID=UPI001D064754|nr:uncharacterized protein LOC123297599 [Chrysoperla carnea]
MNYLNYLFVFLCFFVIVYGQFEDALPASRQLGEQCKLDSHCSPNWSLCGRRTLRCECWDGFIKKGNECIAAIQGLCTEDSDCSSTLPHSFCDQDEKCKCRDTYLASPDRTTCLSPKRINETCILEEECKLYLGFYGQCMVNPANYSSKVCLCSQNSHPSRFNGTCIATVGLNGRCTSDDQCHSTTTESIQLICYDSQCKCPAGYVSDDDRGCRDGAETLVKSFIIVLLMFGFTKIF